MTIRVVFLHGLESGPGGSKAQYLRADSRLEVTAPELPTEAAIAFLKIRREVLPPEIVEPIANAARDSVESARAEVVIGSSFGGGAAMLLAARHHYDGPLVLLAPAGEKLFGIAALPRRRGRVVVIHGRRDDVVPSADSMRFTSASDCDTALWLVDDDHRLKASVDAGLLREAIDWVRRGVDGDVA